LSFNRKHNGQPPEGTCLPGSSGKGNSRGRPPKVIFKLKKHPKQIFEIEGRWRIRC